MNQWFVYDHLPEHLKEVSKPFAELAKQMQSQLRESPEKTAMLRKLLEAKDCAVRAQLFKWPDLPEGPSLGDEK